jgi:hypothetical protein
VTTHSISSWAFHPSVYTHPNGKRLKKDAALQPTASACSQWLNDSGDFTTAAFVTEYIKAMMKKV